MNHTKPDLLPDMRRTKSCGVPDVCRSSEPQNGSAELHRCRWCNLRSPLYIAYHDQEWGVPVHDDHALYELLILEMFQAGLSWETVLNKREHFREAYDGFDPEIVCTYGDDKIRALLQDKGIIRNRLKILASIRNTKVYQQIRAESGSFDAYIWGFTEQKILYENDPAVTTSPLSDRISKDLRRRGMIFCGSTTIYAYLQAIGVIYAHSSDCFLAKTEAAQSES